MHSVVRSICPHVSVIDLSHEVAPFDVLGGSLLLARSVPYLCAGVVLAVVDPGVGTARRAVAVEVGGGQSYLVGPDNGLLAPAVGLCGGATAAVEFTSGTHRLDGPGDTFAGRDVFAPAAAHLCAGVRLEELGDPVDPVTLLPGVVPLPLEEPDGSVSAQVLWVDRFGNCQLNVSPEDLLGLGEDLVVAFGEDQVRRAAPARAYDDVPTGRVGLVTDSYGMVSISLARRPAAKELGLAAGSPLTLRAAGEENGAAARLDSPPPVSVGLGRRRST